MDPDSSTSFNLSPEPVDDRDEFFLSGVRIRPSEAELDEPDVRASVHASLPDPSLPQPVIRNGVPGVRSRSIPGDVAHKSLSSALLAADADADALPSASSSAGIP